MKNKKTKKSDGSPQLNEVPKLVTTMADYCLVPSAPRSFSSGENPLSAGAGLREGSTQRRLCETANRAFFSASPRHFNFLDCETKTSKCFECERETFRLLNFEP